MEVAELLLAYRSILVNYFTELEEEQYPVIDYIGL
jgi:hypothetical protein